MLNDLLLALFETLSKEQAIGEFNLLFGIICFGLLAFFMVAIMVICIEIRNAVYEEKLKKLDKKDKERKTINW